MQEGMQNNVTAWQWLIMFGLAVIAIAITEAIGLTQKWEDAVVFTVVLFAAVLVSSRKLWKKPVFWRNLFLLFVLHLIAVAIFVQAAPVDNVGFPKLALIVGGMIEGLLMLAVLWRKTRTE